MTLVRDLFLRDTKQAREERLDEPPLVVVEQVLAERRLELRARRRVVVVLGDAGAHTHHVRERPVRHALAVGEAAATMPVDVLCEPVEVLVELPREPRLADPGDAHRRDEVCRALFGGGVEELLHEPQFAVAP
jgi:hypothetical protein